MIKYLLCIPAAFIGAIFGIGLFAFLPGIVIITFWYGPDAYEHPEIIAFLMRPAMIVGAILGIIVNIITVD